jgi:hypothetical protein
MEDLWPSNAITPWKKYFPFNPNKDLGANGIVIPNYSKESSPPVKASK